ncbi:MAG: hypothetical protein MJZ21_04565 [archaeon]|nr:hypothetical protein [archaeon]
MEIAVYGKGGIGKSTIASNLSYTFAAKQRRVIHIGCDPKHDSCRSLLNGQDMDTVLDIVRKVPAAERELSMFMKTGSGGVRCIEAGGPEPGVGCAGKGILTMFQTLEKLGLGEVEHDTVVYDVLGDVVCGGFAIPMRPDYTDTIVIVTSGEFMSLYAANNIMRGLLNFEDSNPRLAGIIFNSRGSPKEVALVEEFSQSTGIPIIARIPRSELFPKAESEKHTLCELFPDSEESGIFSDLADHILSLENGGGCFRPTPLTDAQLDELVSEGKVSGRGEYKPRSKTPASNVSFPKCKVFTPVKRIGMGPIGAAITAGKLMDVPVVIHGSRSCGYSMLNELYEERLAHIRNSYSGQIGLGDNVLSTHIGNSETVFGGADNLESLLEDLATKHRFILVILTCLTNMIGDDTGAVVRKVENRHPGICIKVINSNAALEGVDAHMEVLKAIADIIDTSRSSDGKTIRILDDNFMQVDRGENQSILAELMRPFGKTVGTGFLQDCTLDDIREMKTTCMMIRAEDTPDNNELAEILRSKGIWVAKRPLPRGYREGKEWIEHIGKMFDNAVAAKWVSANMDSEYADAVGRCSVVKGKRFAIIDDRSEDTHWIEEALHDAGASEITIYSLGNWEREQYIGEVRRHPNRTEMLEDLRSNAPDMVIGSKFSLRRLDDLVCEPFPSTTLAHTASIMLLERASNVLRSNPNMGWRKWRSSQ